MCNPSHVRRKSCLVLVLVAGISATPSNAQHESADAMASAVQPSRSAVHASAALERTQHVRVKSLLDGHDIRGSSATLQRRRHGLTVVVHTRELDPGESVDVFWAIFNRPEACANPNPLTGAPCSPPDLFIPDTLGSLHYVATLTADAQGLLSYWSSIFAGSDVGCVGDPFPCNTLTNPFGAEVHSAMFVPNGGPGRQAAQFFPMQSDR
jgi:hypothetical protein